MNKFGSTALGALALFGASLLSTGAYASQAPDPSLGIFSASHQTAGFYATLDSVAQTNTWTFSLSVPTTAGFVLESAVPVKLGVPGVTSLTTSLFSALGGAALASTNTLLTLPGGSVFQSLSFAGLATGDYILQTVANGLVGASFSGTVSVSPGGGGPITPIPAALPLFGSALLGLGGLGWRKKARANADNSMVAA
jgi:hypothetical protein